VTEAKNSRYYLTLHEATKKEAVTYPVEHFFMLQLLINSHVQVPAHVFSDVLVVYLFLVRLRSIGPRLAIERQRETLLPLKIIPPKFIKKNYWASQRKTT
jgi:hypothetical protein